MLSEAIRFGQREKLKVIKEKKIKIGYEFEFHPYQKLYENDSDEIIKEVLTSFSDDDFIEYLPDLSYFKEVYDAVSNIKLEPEDIEILLDNIENQKLTKGGSEVLTKIYYGIKIQEDISLNRSEIFDLFSFEDNRKHFLDNALDLIKKINKFDEHEDLLLQPELKEFLENYNELSEVSIKDIKTLIHNIPPSFKEKLIDIFNTVSEGEYINKTIIDMRVKTLFPSTYKLISSIILEHDNQVEIITKHIDIEHSLILFSQIMKIMKLYGYTSNKSGLHVNISYDNGNHSNISFLKYYTLLNTVSIHKRFPERQYTMDLIVEDEFNILDFEIQEYIDNSKSPTMMNVINIVKKTLNNTVLSKYKNVNASFKQFIKDNGRIELRYIGGEGYEDREEEIYNDILRSAQLLEIVYTKDSEKEYNKELLRLLDNVFQKNRNSTFFEYIKELVKAKHTVSKEPSINEASYKGIWYHGTNNAFNDFDVKAERANRGSNVSGIYFTKREYEAKSYGSRIVKAELNIKNPFYGQKKNKISEKMKRKAKELLLIHTRYKEDWIDTVIIPDFVKRGNFYDLRDLNGDVKREILLSGGYESYVDGDHVVVLSPNKHNVRIID